MFAKLIMFGLVMLLFTNPYIAAWTTLLAWFVFTL